MESITYAIDKIVRRKPYLSEFLVAGIINISALARQIQHEVEQILQRRVNTGAVIMSLNRMVPSLQGYERSQLDALLDGMGDLVLRSNLCDITYKNSPTLPGCHLNLLKRCARSEDFFYTVVQGVFETNIVVSEKMKPMITELYAAEECIFKRRDLSSVTLKLPKGNTMQPGFYFSIMKELAWEGINLVEVISSTNEFTVIVDNKVIDRTFIVLKNIGRGVTLTGEETKEGE